MSNYELAQKQVFSPVYAKGMDFNAKQKYDYNILNGQSLSHATLNSGRRSIPQQPQAVLQAAASQMFNN